MVLGIVWIFGVGAVLALIFGLVSRRQIQASNGSQGGGGMATAGIVLGLIGIAAVILWIVAGIAFVHGVNTDFNHCLNNPNAINNPNAPGCGGTFGNTGGTGIVRSLTLFARF
jgi:Domain of unknown function (DUF4190)